MTFNQFYAGFKGLSDGEKRNGKEHLRAAFKAGRAGKLSFLDFVASEPLVTSLPASSQAAMQRSLSYAFENGRLA